MGICRKVSETLTIYEVMSAFTALFFCKKHMETF